MKKAILGLALLSLCGCDDERSSEKQRMAREPVLVTTARDGTKLWKTYDPDDDYYPIYFSTGGTTHTVPNGKSTRSMIVPSSKIASVKLCDDAGSCRDVAPDPESLSNLSVIENVSE